MKLVSPRPDSSTTETVTEQADGSIRPACCLRTCPATAVTGPRYGASDADRKKITTTSVMRIDAMVEEHQKQLERLNQAKVLSHRAQAHARIARASQSNVCYASRAAGRVSARSLSSSRLSHSFPSAALRTSSLCCCFMRHFVVFSPDLSIWPRNDARATVRQLKALRAGRTSARSNRKTVPVLTVRIRSSRASLRSALRKSR